MCGLAIRIITSIVLTLLVCLVPMQSFADTHAAATCSYSDVNAKVAEATYGDTVTIPIGNCTWSSELVVTKYMTIQGAGSDGSGTNITQDIWDSCKGIIKYDPDAKSIADDGAFRVTNIRFLGQNTTHTVGRYEPGQYGGSRGVYVYPDLVTPKKYIKNIRIDHNEFHDFRVYLNYPYHCHGSPVAFDQMAFGLVDNNYFHNCMNIKVIGQTGYEWSTVTPEVGTDNSVYIEDNLSDTFSALADSACGGRMVMRFNKSQNNRGGEDEWDELAWHGNSSGLPNYTYSTWRGSPSGEAYYNLTMRNLATNGVRLAYMRGGICLAFGNKITNTSTGLYTMGFVEEDQSTFDLVPSLVRMSSINGANCYRCIQDNTASAGNQPGTSGGNAYWSYCGTYSTSTSMCTGGSPNTCSQSESGADQTWAIGNWYRYNHGFDPVNSSYSFNNYMNDTLMTTINTNSSSNTLIPENTAWWKHNTSFNGTVGVGVGTRAQMDAITSCTNGVGYWVTDEGHWNHSNGGNYLSYTGQGQLYRCASNAWVLHYTPYDYPHPLRGGIPSTAQDITISGRNCTSLVQLQCSESTWPTDTKTMVVNTGVAGTCKYDTSSASYSEMGNTFSDTGGVTHSQSLSVDCGSSYSYYVKCSDSDPGVNCLFGVDKDPPPRKTYNITELKLWKSPL